MQVQLLYLPHRDGSSDVYLSWLHHMIGCKLSKADKRA